MERVRRARCEGNREGGRGGIEQGQSGWLDDKKRNAAAGYNLVVAINKAIKAAAGS